jgi:hypothetical protein
MFCGCFALKAFLPRGSELVDASHPLVQDVAMRCEIGLTIKVVFLVFVTLDPVPTGM